MYYDTLQAAATIAQTLGETNTATQWLDEATRVRKGINRYLYDSSEPRYVTSIIDEHIINPGPHAQALPFAYGIVPEAEIPLVATALLDLTERDPARANVQLFGFGTRAVHIAGVERRIPLLNGFSCCNMGNDRLQLKSGI
ncbi:MAG: hypothetical protein KatS3mg109_1882 [Pirellulaceae bacterium]|nr:MAG: hypothetical protein KatS3mg109_1882 [Pirellulaceae bacterium]